MSLYNCSGFTINDGHFTKANRVYNNFNIRKSVGTTQKKEKKRTMWDDASLFCPVTSCYGLIPSIMAQYNHVRTGDIYIERTIATPSSVRREYRHDEEGRMQYRLWRNVDAQRSFSIARLEGRNRERKFLYVTYDGPDALKAFKQDFQQFAHIKNANVAQIFGYNDNERGLPALVFYDALIPLGRIIIDGGRLTPLLYSYFSHQFGRMQRELSGRQLVGELWVDPRTGALQKGLYLKLPSFQSWVMSTTGEHTMPNTYSNHLPIQTYSNNDAVFEYLTRTFTARTILTGIGLAFSGFIQTLTNEQVIPVLSSLSGAVYDRRSRDVIARLPGARERWHYEFWGVESRIPDGMRESQVVMDDGSVRFTVTSMDMQNLQEITIEYLLYPGEEWRILAESWLAKAHSVFSQFGIHEDDWGDYSILYSFTLHLERTSPHQEPNIPSNAYLFIRPVPRPSDDDAIWRSWLEDEKHFWSFDPLGREIVPELVRAHSGLPSFTSGIDAWPLSWSVGHYNAVQKLHISEGFDPTTTDFALSLGFPVLKVIGDQHRFEDLGESNSNSLRRFVDKLKTRGARFITKAKVGFGAKKDLGYISFEETTSSKGFARRLEDVFHIRRRTGKA